LRTSIGALGVRPGEGARVLRLVAFAFLVTAAVVLAKSAQRELFLAAYPRSRIPDAFLLSALSLALASVGIFAVAARVGLARLMRGLLAAGVVLWLGGWAAVRFGLPGAPLGLYVLVEAMCSLLIVQTWAVIAEALDVRSAKRLLPVVGLGAGAAWTFGGFSVSALAQLWGPSALLFCAPLLLLLALGALGVVLRRDLAGGGGDGRGKEASGLSAFGAGLRYIAQEPLMRVLAFVAVVEVVVEKAIDFQMLSTAQATLGGTPGGVTSFMGMFYGVTGALTLAAPFVFSGKVLSKFGSTRALAGAQLWALCASLLFFFVPVLAAMVLLAGGERVLKQALSAPARSQILGVVPSVRRAQAAAALSGILGAGAAAAASLALRAYPEALSVRWLSLGVVGLMAALVAVSALFLRKSYVLALQRSVDRRKLDFDEQDGRRLDLDGERVFTLTRELESGDPARGEFAVSIASRAEPAQGRPLLHAALVCPMPTVQAAAAAALGRMGDAQDAPRLARTLEATQDEEVRCAGLAALAALGTPDHALLLRLREDPRPRVRALCWACLAREADGGDPVQLVGLLTLLASPDATERAAAAWAIGEVPSQREALRRAFVPLMSDTSLEVRRAALRAAARWEDGQLVRAVMLSLEEPRLSAPAFEVLSQLDEEAVGRVEALLPSAPVAIVGRTASALARAEGGRASAVLEHLLEHRDGQVRYGASRALGVRRRAQRWSPDSRETLLARIAEELEQGYRYHEALRGLTRVLEVGQAGEAERRFVQGEVESRIAETERRLLSLIALLSDPRLARLCGHLRGDSPSLAARVLELVEQSVEPALAAKVVPFLEARPAQLSAEAGEAVPDDPLVTLMALGDDHLRRCALLAFRDKLAGRFADVLVQEGPLLHLVERIRFLRSVPLFKGLSPEDLMKLAEIAEPTEHAAGEVIFRKGDVGDVLCVVVGGRVEIRDQGQVIATPGPNDFFGELALFDNEPRSADAVCAEKTELLEIQGVDLDGLMERRPEIAREIIRVLARRLRKTTQAMVVKTISLTNLKAVGT
jgi:hypothetical protein